MIQQLIQMVKRLKWAVACIVLNVHIKEFAHKAICIMQQTSLFLSASYSLQIIVYSIEYNSHSVEHISKRKVWFAGCVQYIIEHLVFMLNNEEDNPPRHLNSLAMLTANVDSEC